MYLIGQSLYILGLYKMTIQDNPLTFLNEDSLHGLEHSLWELELINTHITYVPSKAIRALQKLKILNLSGMYGELYCKKKKTPI